MKGKGKEQSEALRWISSVVGKSLPFILLLMVLQALRGVLSVFDAMVLRRLVDEAVAHSRPGFVSAAILFVLVLLLQIILLAATRYLSEYVSAVLSNRFKHRLFSVLMTHDYEKVTSVHSGEWMNRLTSDTSVVTDGVITILPGLMGTLVRLVGALVAILYLEPGLLLILLPAGFLLAVVSLVFRKMMKSLHKEVQEADGRLRVFLQERFSALLVVRSFGSEENTIRDADALMEEHKGKRMKRSVFSNLCSTGFAFAMEGSYIFGALYCGYALLMGTMSYGNLLAVLQLIGQVQNPFANISGYLPKFYSMVASAERLMEAEAFGEDKGERMEKDLSSFYREEFVSLGLRGVTFSYKDSTPVLRDFSLEVKKGGFYALRGPSGCGKSTVLKLLMHLFPSFEGEAYISTKEGEMALDTRHRPLFAYVPQGNQLLSGTIREVVAFGDKERMKEEEAIWKALAVASADTFVRDLEKGLDTLLGERGAGLSEGQMQRLAIARAVFSDHPILLLDEATASIDEETSRTILQNLRSMTDRTVVMVSHRSEESGLFDKEIFFSPEGRVNNGK